MVRNFLKIIFFLLLTQLVFIKNEKWSVSVFEMPVPEPNLAVD